MHHVANDQMFEDIEYMGKLGVFGICELGRVVSLSKACRLMHGTVRKAVEGLREL